MEKPYRPANPLIWGAVLGIIAAILVVVTQSAGQVSGNDLLATPMKASGAAFGLGFAVALFRNWFNERRPGR